MERQPLLHLEGQQVEYGSISLCVGAVNTAPIEYMRIDSTGTITNQNNLNLTITNPSRQGAINLLSGNTNNYVSYGLGRTSREFDIGIASTNGNFVTSSVPGDAVLVSSAGNIRLGVGVTEIMRINSTGVTANTFNGNLNGIVNGTGESSIGWLKTVVDVGAGSVGHLLLCNPSGVQRGLLD